VRDGLIAVVAIEPRGDATRAGSGAVTVGVDRPDESVDALAGVGDRVVGAGVLDDRVVGARVAATRILGACVARARVVTDRIARDGRERHRPRLSALTADVTLPASAAEPSLARGAARAVPTGAAVTPAAVLADAERGVVALGNRAAHQQEQSRQARAQSDVSKVVGRFQNCPQSPSSLLVA
jgi:hypothetical protein